MDVSALAAVVSLALTLAAAVFGAKYQKTKALLRAVVDAAEDDEVSEEEFQAIVAAAKGLKSED